MATQQNRPSTATGLLDVEEAATLLGVSARHLRRLVAERRIPYIKWGSRLHFDPMEIKEWVDRHRQRERGVY
jgi:excisionase family DNA binding protein